MEIKERKTLIFFEGKFLLFFLVSLLVHLIGLDKGNLLEVSKMLDEAYKNVVRIFEEGKPNTRYELNNSYFNDIFEISGTDIFKNFLGLLASQSWRVRITFFPT